MTILSGSIPLRVLRFSLVLLAVATLSAQVVEHRPRVGIPFDWTQRHLLFHHSAFAQHPERALQEPRILFQAMREQGRPAEHVPLLGGEAADSVTERDWNVSLGTGHVAFGMSPAKFGFDPTQPPSCSADFVLFGLNVAGTTGGQANLVAYNNLYSGTGGLCGTGSPTVLFAYNTSTQGGRILTSPVLSLDGTQIAFVESAGNSSIFHVVKWASGAGNGTSATSSAFPGTGNTATITSLTYAATATDTRSAPWVDYVNDVAYVGADDGKIYKITPVFKGTPALAGAPWPVTLAAGRRLTPPVLDQSVTKNLFVGDGQGMLYQLDSTNPTTIKTLAVGRQGSRNSAVLDAPLVDSSDGTLFAVSSNDGTSAVLVQASTSTFTQMTRARIGLGSTGGTNVNLYDGAFNNNYFTSPASGYIFVCGTGVGDTTPRRYLFGFTGVKMNTNPASQTQILTSTRARCGPISEFFNQNIGATGTDFFFWGMTADCKGNNTSGCIFSRTNLDVVTSADAAAGTSVIITDNDSTLGQASSVYFTNEGNPPVGVKLTQNGLQ